MHPWSDIVSTTFGTLCLLSAVPLVGIPFPSRSWANYYEDKNKWIAFRTGGRLTAKQAGYAGALLRLAVGSCCIYPPTRIAALTANSIVVSYGTVAAYQNSRPMSPQWSMLSAMGLCILLEVL
ncbi:hypothetical protein F5Y06DRAFT_277025 [Hypoxylon sp. FL0890]|nr:hypothetical protein F5Y06DRAFT_277025 [Hypoxylon sp. FL0890]